jgi:hypothetical protein
MISHRVRNYVSPYVLDAPVLDAQPTMPVKKHRHVLGPHQRVFCKYLPP